jgi:hypothetical protein
MSVLYCLMKIIGREDEEYVQVIWVTTIAVFSYNLEEKYWPIKKKKYGPLSGLFK